MDPEENGQGEEADWEEVVDLFSDSSSKFLRSIFPSWGKILLDYLFKVDEDDARETEESSSSRFAGLRQFNIVRIRDASWFFRGFNRPFSSGSEEVRVHIGV